MKKRYVLLVSLLLACAALLASCNGGGTPSETTPHEHAFGEWSAVKDPSCVEEGRRERACSCGEKETEVLAAVGHAYESAVTSPTKTEGGFTTHVCSNCGDTYTDSFVPATGSLGLAYQVNEDNTTCTIKGMGTCTDDEIVIPETIDGYTVTSIGWNAFRNEKTIKSVRIPDTVTTIVNSAFSGCTALESVTIPGVQYIDYGAFSGCTSLASVVIRDGAVKIWHETFLDCKNLKSIVIPKSITDIGFEAFVGCERLQKVYYGGTADTWSAIAFVSEDRDLILATRYYYSETEPTESGNYWHWVDGVPTAW